MSTSFTVTHQRDRYSVSFDLSTTNLLILKEFMSHLTGVPIDGIKLMFSGALLRDDNKSLVEYRITEGSKIMMLGQSTRVKDYARDKSKSPVLSVRSSSFSSDSMVTVPEFKESKPDDPTVERIKVIIEKAFEFLPQLDTFDNDVLVFEATSGDAQDQWKKLDYTSKFLNENFLRLIIDLDNVDVDGNQNARQVRKAAIQQIQAFLNRLDYITGSLKEKMK